MRFFPLAIPIMKKLELPSWAAVNAYLFEQPISNAYLLLNGTFILFTLCSMQSERLPDLVKHLGWVACWLLCARLSESKYSRWAWAGMGALLVLVVGLDMAVTFLS